MKNNQDTISYNRKVGNRIKALREEDALVKKKAIRILRAFLEE